MVTISRGRCRLLQVLARTKLSQVELSRRTGYNKDDLPAKRKGYSTQQINNWAHDREPMPFEAIATVAYICDCQMEDLYDLIINP